MKRNKGQFVRKKKAERSTNSSDRLRVWHDKHKEQTTGKRDILNANTASDNTNSSDEIFHVEDSALNTENLPSGRRIVELKFIIEQLKSCVCCRSQLSLCNTLKEDRFGFGSVLTVLCGHCGKRNKIDTNKRHRHEGCDRGPKSFVINTKVAIGMLHSGIGLAEINKFMSTIEVPSIYHRVFKIIERRIGEHVVSVAKASCKSALHKEEEETAKTLLSSKSVDVTAREKADVTPVTLTDVTTNTSTDVSREISTNAHPESSPVNIPETCTVFTPERSTVDVPETSTVFTPERSTVDIPETSTVFTPERSTVDVPETSTAETPTLRDGSNTMMSIPLDHDYTTARKRLSGQFKYDMGWQKRGSGRCYDSRSGVGTMIGNLNGKICAYGVRSKSCKKCDYHKARGTEIPEHTCSRNWTGSSKAMEPDVAGELVKEIEEDNIDVGVLIMDDDCTTIARVRKDLKHDVEKWSDHNHTVKHIGNSLYALQKKHKVLSTMVVKHIQKCFNYALAQNKGDVERFTVALKQIVPHLFGEHDHCGAWCGYKKNPETYKHKGLPYGRPLTGTELRDDIDAVFQVIIKNAASISQGASTRDVESFNNMVAEKAPKKRHYAGSESLYIRTSCAVAQKNIGATYVNEVYKSIGISPGKFYGEHAIKQNKKRQRALEKTNSVEFKRRRIELKSKMRVDNFSKEIHEGPTYQSGIASSGRDTDVSEIPPPKFEPTRNKITTVDFHDSYKVFCDIETTSLHNDADITQLAAICGEDIFNCYVLPTKPISPAASKVTGLVVSGNSMFYHGKEVETHNLEEGLKLFVTFLEHHQPCVLVGHNFMRFDFPRIIRAFDLSLTLEPLSKYVLGIADTLTLFKAHFKDLEKYSQEHLVSHFLKEQYTAHNALGDVRGLQKLCTAVAVTDSQFSEHSYSVHSAIDTFKFRCESIKNCQTFNEMYSNKAISKGIMEKLSNSGLCLAHLRLAINRAGLDGLKHLLSTITSYGKPRVTKNSKIIEKIFQYLQGSTE